MARARPSCWALVAVAALLAGSAVARCAARAAARLRLLQPVHAARPARSP